jgi:general secretion pathway protein D
VVTQVFRLSYAGVNDLVPVLRPLISANNTINANAANNTLVITDYANNLARLGELIAALDTPSATDVEVIPLQYALAADLARDGAEAVRPVRRGLAGRQPAAAARARRHAPSGSSGLAVIADPHLNALLVKGANAPRAWPTIRALVARLDRAGASRSNIHVIYLKNTDAVRLATVLRAAFATDSSRTGTSGGGAGAGVGGGATGAANGLGGGSSPSAHELEFRLVGQQHLGRRRARPDRRRGRAVHRRLHPGRPGVQRADRDRRRAAVPRAARHHRRARRAARAAAGGVGGGGGGCQQGAGRGHAMEVHLQHLVDTSLTLGTVAQAIQATSGTNILSTANLVTLDNEEAKIVVGQNVPFVTGSYTSTSSSSTNPFQTIERKDVGITLRIRPQIGTNGTIRMAIYQESSSVASTAATGTESAGPTTNKRAIETNVVVDDGKIIVLGGLIEDSYTVDREAVPVLEKIPYLGALFRNLSRTRKRTNLLVFLRPVIMRDDGHGERADARSLRLHPGQPAAACSRRRRRRCRAMRACRCLRDPTAPLRP